MCTNPMGTRGAHRVCGAELGLDLPSWHRFQMGTGPLFVLFLVWNPEIVLSWPGGGFVLWELEMCPGVQRFCSCLELELLWAPQQCWRADVLPCALVRGLGEVFGWLQSGQTMDVCGLPSAVSWVCSLGFDSCSPLTDFSGNWGHDCSISIIISQISLPAPSVTDSSSVFILCDTNVLLSPFPQMKKTIKILLIKTISW